MGEVCVQDLGDFNEGTRWHAMVLSWREQRGAPVKSPLVLAADVALAKNSFCCSTVYV